MRTGMIRSSTNIMLGYSRYQVGKRARVEAVIWRVAAELGSGGGYSPDLQGSALELCRAVHSVPPATRQIEQTWKHRVKFARARPMRSDGGSGQVRL